MANQYVQVPPDSTGKKMQTFENTVSGQIVEAEAVTLVRSSDNTEVGTSGQPLRIDPTGTTAQPTNIHGSGGVVLDAVLAATKPANVLQVGGNDGTNAYAIPLVSGGGAVVDDVAQWGGTTLPAAPTTSPMGTEAAPIVRELAAKTPRSISTTPPSTSSTVYYGPLAGNTTSALAGWYDTAQTGATWVQCQVYADHGQVSGGNGYYLIQTSDPANTNETPSQVAVVAQANGQTSAFAGAVTKRYWQIKVINGNVAVTAFELTSSEWQGAPGVAINPSTGAQNLDGTAVADAVQPAAGPVQPYMNVNGNLRSGPGAVTIMLAGAGGSGGPFYFQRTPNIFKTTQVAATTSGNSAVWTPTSGKKFRLMRFQIQGVNLVATAATVLTISFQDNTTGMTIGTYDVLLPASATATGLLVGGVQFDSGWIDLGNGFISAAANNVLNLNIGATITGATGSFRVNCCGTEE